MKSEDDFQYTINFFDSNLEKMARFIIHSENECDRLRNVANELHAAQHRMHLTAFGVGLLSFLAGFGICWFVFVR